MNKVPKKGFTLERVTVDDPIWDTYFEWLTKTYFNAIAEELLSTPIGSFRSPDSKKSSDLKLALYGLLKDQNKACLFVAKVENTNAGYFLGLIKDCIAENPSYIGYINGLYVVPELRRQGVAQSLLNAGTEWFASKGARLVELYIAINNQAGRGFWIKNGYIPSEEVLFKSIEPGKVPIE